MFFKSEPLLPAVQAAVQDALQTPAVADPTAAQSQAAAKAQEVVSTASGLAPQWMAFAVAAGVIVVLLYAAIILAQQADAQAKDVVTSQLKDLSKVVQTLLVAWSAAILGLIGGEAIGKKA